MANAHPLADIGANATLRVPPAWSVENESKYPFRHFERDVRLWATATDVDPLRLGPLVALRVSGVAQDLVREINPTNLAHGGDLHGQRLAGLDFLLTQLRLRFAPMRQEEQISVISEFMGFTRLPQESTDAAIGRFVVMRHRATNEGDFQMSDPGCAVMLLRTLNIPGDKWPLILAPTQGLLPANDAQFGDFLLYLRRNGHMFDRAMPTDSYKRQVRAYHMSDASTESQPCAFESDSSVSWAGMWQHTYAATSSPPEPETPVWFDEESCDDEEDADLTDVFHMDMNSAAEHLYLQYREAKQRWRTFTGRKHLKGKGKGTSKGHRTSHSKGKSAWPARTSTWWTQEGSTDAVETEAYKGFTKGSPKGNYSKGMGKNPIGKDGKRLRCSVCQSEEHLRAACPKNTQTYMQENTPDHGAYWHVEVAAEGEETTDTHLDEWLSFVVFSCYHSQVRLKEGREGILLDIGAVKNLCGDKWLQRVTALANTHGHGVSVADMKQSMKVQGVGTGCSETHEQCVVPLALSDGSRATYTAPIVRDSELPALWGLEGLARQRAVIDTANNKLYLPGPGGLKISASPGSRVLNLERAASGHLLLPVTEWLSKANNPQSTSAFSVVTPPPGL
eukprot:6491542-Amphidinium_carterae.2